MAANPHCRIGTIRYKNSNLIEIRPKLRGADLPVRMKKNFEEICSYYPDGMAGMVIVAWGFDGGWSRATRIHKDSFVGQTLMPSFVEDILRRDTMKDVVHDTIQWVE